MTVEQRVVFIAEIAEQIDAAIPDKTIAALITEQNSAVNMQKRRKRALGDC